MADVSVLSIDRVEDLAARAIAAIDERLDGLHPTLRHGALNLNADRARVASDLAGLRLHREQPARRDVLNGHVVYEAPALCHSCRAPWACPDFRRYADGLLRTAALYGVADNDRSHAHG